MVHVLRGKKDPGNDGYYFNLTNSKVEIVPVIAWIFSPRSTCTIGVLIHQVVRTRGRVIAFLSPTRPHGRGPEPLYPPPFPSLLSLRLSPTPFLPQFSHRFVYSLRTIIIFSFPQIYRKSQNKEKLYVFNQSPQTQTNKRGKCNCDNLKLNWEEPRQGGNPHHHHRSPGSTGTTNLSSHASFHVYRPH